MKDIRVSIICMAYNQEKYIAEALNSMLNQKTFFSYEIIVHDDCSTDATTKIIKDYENRYPDLIKAYYETENQYSKGIDVFMELCFPRARGKYIAICEGDDYWTDEEKLQLQYDVMEKHPELDMCAGRAVEMTGSCETADIRPMKQDGILSAEQVILGGGRYLATNTLFYRKELFSKLMNFEKVISFDYSSQIKGSLRGGIYYIDRKMAVYRRATESSWTRRVEQNKEKRDAHLKVEIAMLRQLDLDTTYKYHDCIEQRITAYTPFINQLTRQKDAINLEIDNLGSGKMIYLWGLGMRGDAIQEFCQKENIELRGVCDKKDEHLGEMSAYNFPIISTNEALENAKVIFAANHAIYEDLLSRNLEIELIDFQKYMPLS